MSPEEAARRLRLYPQELDRAVRRGMGRSMTLAAKNAKEALKRTAIGASLWTGRRPASGRAPLIVKVIPARISETEGGAILSGLHAEGFAALIETGGRTAPHRIAPRTGQFLRFQVADGEAFARMVRHPGGPVRKIPILHQQLDRIEPVLRREIDSAMVQAVEKVGL